MFPLDAAATKSSAISTLNITRIILRSIMLLSKKVFQFSKFVYILQYFVYTSSNNNLRTYPDRNLLFSNVTGLVSKEKCDLVKKFRTLYTL